MSQSGVIGRFAPSPTGMLHLGSLSTALGSWLSARSQGGKWLLRIDDLDSPRIVNGCADDIMATLERYGLFWDGNVARQSRNLECYQESFNALLTNGLIYPCYCSRKDLEGLASPQSADDAAVYPALCRHEESGGRKLRSWRVKTDGEVYFKDTLHGSFRYDLATSYGDFVVRRADSIFAYHLAVVIDDHLSGVTEIVRGGDLLTSTPRQIYLQELLGFSRPLYAHLPLVIAPDGGKLSKRDNLVSVSLGNFSGFEGKILCEIMSAFGMSPPTKLEDEACEEILKWGAENFKLSLLPIKNFSLQL